MNKDKRNIEDSFQREFEHFEVSPSDKVWKQVRADLFKKHFMQFTPGSFNIYYLSAIVLTGLATILALSTVKKRNKDTGIPPTQPIEVQSIEKSVIDLSPDKQTRTAEYKNNRIKSDTRTAKDIPGKSATEPVNVLIQDTQPNTVIKTDPVGQETVNSEPPFIPSPVPLSYFSISNRNGCAPLSVTFSNHSENSSSYSWSFGDGGSSIEKNPSYLYDKPGTFFVNLTVMSGDGDLSTHTDSIHVYPLPDIHFDIDPLGIPGSGQPVYFYNYSQGAEYFQWGFGDGQTSIEKDPSHYYQDPGIYDICLIAQSVHGCRDSLAMKNVFSAKAPEIIFPNAFSPNRNGSTNGYYNLKDPRNDIFHPVINQEVEDYQLKIFNRTGILIFESNDINIGWDGYYQQELLPQGVYVYKARGRFVSGRSFVKMGDVTLIRMKE